MHSHEILFDKKIPLDKYCKCIIMYDYNLTDKKENVVLDIICGIILIGALFKGYTKGFIIALFSFAAKLFS